MDADAINKRILSAFQNVKSFPLKRIVIQLWSPEKTLRGKRVLSCSSYPYALTRVNNRLWKYRSGCCNYYYSLDDWGEVDDAITITGAPPSTAVLYGFPEVVLDLRVHRGTPLVDLALECELTCFMMLPLFYETRCLGVIEVSMRLPSDLLVIFNELNRELTRVGLRMIPPMDTCMPAVKGTGDWKPVRSEIEKALQVAVQSHAITLGQLWLPYENYNRIIGRNRIPLPMIRMLAAKLSSYHADGDDHLSLVKLFYDNIPVFPFKKGEGLVGRAVKTHQPHLCRNIHKLSDNRGVLALLSANTKSCACFVICLRSSHTGELDYALEFFWTQSRNHLALMEDLLLTLRENLPSFKYASGAQLGDELLVVDVENSSSSSGSASESKTIKIFPRNKISKTPKKTRASVGMKRKSIDLHHGQSELNQYPFNNQEEEDDDDDDLVILAVYKVYTRLFFLPNSPTFENVMDKIKLEFEHELNPVGTYKVEYQVLPGKWYSLTDDTCLKNCISSYQTSNNIDYIKFYVVAVEE